MRPGRTLLPEGWPRTILLLHAHTDHVRQQIRIAGTRRDGIAFDGLFHRVRGVFLLVNPVDLSPGEHLRSLARLAQVADEVEDPDCEPMVERLRESALFGDGAGHTITMQ